MRCKGMFNSPEIYEKCKIANIYNQKHQGPEK